MSWMRRSEPLSRSRSVTLFRSGTAHVSEPATERHV